MSGRHRPGSAFRHTTVHVPRESAQSLAPGLSSEPGGRGLKLRGHLSPVSVGQVRCRRVPQGGRAANQWVLSDRFKNPLPLVARLCQEPNDP